MAPRPFGLPSAGARAALSRALLLVFWSLVLWGTLLAGGILWRLVGQGWQGSQSVLHPHGWDGWSNALLAPFALAVWGVVFLVLALGSGKKSR